MKPPEGITALPNGQWVITEDTHLSRWALEKGHIVTDPHLFRFLRPHVEPVEVVWDIGANIGDHTRQYLDWGKEVVAVEPNPLVFACLAHNCPEAHCIHAAASDHEGEPLRFMHLDNVGASRIHKDGALEVYPVVMDEQNIPAPGFVKIDVEGWEPNVLRGMERTIQEHRPTVFIEINRGALRSNDFDPEDIYRFFRTMGYTIYGTYPQRATFLDEQFDVLFVP